MNRLAWLAFIASALTAASPDIFESAVAPILKARCGECHGEKAKTSGFSVASRESVIAGGNKHGRAIVEGNAGQSVLVKLLKGSLAPSMPIGASLAPAEIATIEGWINALPKIAVVSKSEWRWPYEKPLKKPLPQTKDAEWSRNPIDAFVANRLERESFPHAPEASKRTLARRVYIDLVGLPPSPEEMRAYLSDESPNAYEKLIDRLLADTRYGERWGRHWLDLARYGETSGLEGDGAIGNAWRYRDWVIEAFNNNMPYDKFVIQQLGGGDEHSKTRNNYQPDPQGFVATGFLRVAPWDRSNLVAADVRQNFLAETTTAVSSIFLGLTVGCARCHDHKYDPIPQKDYYRLQAFFNATEAGRSISVPYKNAAFAAKAESKIRDLEARVNGPEKKELDAFEQTLLKKLIDGRKQKSTSKEWTKTDLRLELRLKQQRIFTPAEKERHDDLLEASNRTGDTDEQKATDAYEAMLLEKLKVAYTGGTDPAGRYEALTLEDVRTEATAKYSGKSIFTPEEKAKHGELSAKVDNYRRQLARWKTDVLCVTVVPGPPSGPDIAPTRVLFRGDYRQPREAVEPGFPSVILGSQGPAAIESDRYLQYPTRGLRLTLAKWIASRDNPLTARVMVNRIWQHHFGEGIVRTPSDFGKNGDKPSHPELLDWLAVDFMEHGWDVKAMHKLILTSNTYKQSAENPLLKENPKDGDNRLLWRQNRRRLEAEAIRDGILAASGRLNPEMGGPSVFPPLPADLADFARYGRTGGLMWEPNEKDEDARRRSVYIFQRRSLPLPMMAAFDAIVFSESCERRSSTTTPLQALAMMNGYLVNEESAHIAKRAEREGGSQRAEQIARMFELILNRPARPEEIDKFSRFGGSLESVSRVLLNSNEFLYSE